MTTLDEGVRKACKVHVCDWCGARIEPGERYAYRTIADGEVWTNKLHVAGPEQWTCQVWSEAYWAYWYKVHPLTECESADWPWMTMLWETMRWEGWA